MDKALVLVTGASGYLGAHCVKVLLGRGYRVRGTVRSLKNALKVEPVKKLDPSGKLLTLIEADLNKKDGWENAVAGCEYVLHVASPFPLGGTQETIDTAIAGTKNVFEACAKETSVKKVVLTSSLVAVSEGHRAETRRLTEDDWSILEGSIAYVKSKTLAEKAAWDFVKEKKHKNNFPLTVILPGAIMGPPLTDDKGTSVESAVQMMTMSGLPRITFACIDVRDCATAHVEAMTRPESDGMRVICCEADPIYLTDMAKRLSEEFVSQGYSPATKTIPDWIIKVGSVFSGKLSALAPRLGMETRFDNTRLREVLGVHPNDSREAMVDMAYELIDRGIIKKTPKYRGKPKSRNGNTNEIHSVKL
ncbi:unnamed protein product, partial [Mesorhabditis belari]|uniref:3-beta hydroxysteroid dehydrogenase/isomerase domain-containing protein n=1 Tax=Mesorhabditis belari TaxID=2138241 RepID=A0AAF3F9S2_9BILA